jgi:hypothetical protein
MGNTFVPSFLFPRFLYIVAVDVFHCRLGHFATRRNREEFVPTLTLG